MAPDLEGYAKDIHICVTSHGDFIPYLVNDLNAGMFNNAEWRSYEFSDPTYQSNQAQLKETEWSKTRRSSQPTLGAKLPPALISLQRRLYQDFVARQKKGLFPIHQ